MGHIRQLAERIELDEDAMLRSLRSRLIGGEKASKAETDRECRALRRQLHELETLTARLYEDRVTGAIQEENFTAVMEANEAERLETAQRLALLEQSEQEAAAMLSDTQHWMRLIREKALLENVDRDLLEALVERIEVGEREVVNGEKRQNIRIIYKFVGLL